MARRESQVVVGALTYSLSRGVGRVREDQLGLAQTTNSPQPFGKPKSWGLCRVPVR